VGQSSIEYMGALFLVAALLALAAPLAGGPPVAAAVMRQIQHALCVVTGDVCSAEDARRAGLGPCTLREDGRASDNGATFLVFRAGKRTDWVLAQRSDGTFVVSRSADTDLGVGFDVGVGGVSVDGSFDGGFHEGWQWEFPDAASVQQFLKVISRWETLDQRPPPTYTYKSLAGVPQLAGAGGSVAGGVRTGHGRRTLFLRARLDDLGAFEALGLGSRWRDVVLEHTSDGSGARELAFRLSGPGSAAGTVMRVTGRLDLRDPVNAALARSLLQLRVPDFGPLVARTRAAGTIEAELFSVRSSTSGQDVSLPVIRGLGLRNLEHRRAARLLSARAWVGGREVAREDCQAA
jgi:hypothetical protein